jgi:hypothetical protein
MSRHVVPDPKDPTKKLLRNEGFYRAEVSSRGLACNHPGANCDFTPFNWYDVPFGVMVPANPQQASNLLVPVCISASSVAYSSARIENMFMDLGSAAGVAVAELLGRGTTKPGDCPILAVQGTNVSAVQDVLSTVYKQKFHGPAVPPSQKTQSVNRRVRTRERETDTTTVVGNVAGSD